MSEEPRSQALWLLVIIHLSGQVDGITRLQKLAFLTNEIVPMEQHGFYSDWKSGKYGPFSPSMADDIDLLLRQGLIEKQTVESAAGYTLDSFRATPKGQSRVEGMRKQYPKQVEMIQKSVVQKYARAPLMSLLHDTYFRAPQYTTQSEIAGEIFDLGKRRASPDP